MLANAGNVRLWRGCAKKLLENRNPPRQEAGAGSGFIQNDCFNFDEAGHVFCLEIHALFFADLTLNSEVGDKAVDDNLVFAGREVAFERYANVEEMGDHRADFGSAVV